LSAPPNLLSSDGEAILLAPGLDSETADAAFSALRHHVPWAPDELVMFGRRIVTAREVAWYGDPGLSYRYSGCTKEPLPWFPLLAELRDHVSARAEAPFNACLLNLYHDGREGMGWHSDDEPEIIPESCIASLSLGAPRRFVFRHRRTRETVQVVLPHGSLLLMRGPVQSHWQHALPKATAVADTRINLTFRLLRRR
jgi:alkylated DNA repair dioxygenase AlkB